MLQLFIQIVLIYTGVELTRISPCSLELSKRFEKGFEVSLRDLSPQFNCILKCRAWLEPFSDKNSMQPKYREKVFDLKKNSTQCQSQQRNVATFYMRKVKGINLQQIRDHPLFYFNEVSLKSYFGAQKFCRRLGLDFGLVKLVDDILSLTFMSTAERVEIWAGNVITRNKTDANYNWAIECTVYYKENGKVFSKPSNCNAKKSFFCSLPEIAHSTRCEKECYGSDCKQEEEEKDICDPTCAQPECPDEITDKYSYRGAADGDLIEVCGRKYLISKAVNLNYKSAETFCCTKSMDLVSIETPAEMKCLAKEILKLGFNNTQFWTSGNSMPCANTFAWCAANEIIDKYNLPWSPPNAKHKNCVALRALNGTNGTALMAFDNEPSSQIKRAICEGETVSKCNDSKCYYPKCLAESITAKAFSRKTPGPGVTFITGCNRTFTINAYQEVNYHQSSKWCCAGNNTLLSIKDAEAMKCLQEQFKINKVQDNSKYWISASSIGCPSVLRWCDLRDNPLVGNHLKWAKGEPSKDQSKECVYLSYSNTTGEFLFAKDSCRASYFFLCHGQ